jgi:hypothetical protein
LYLQSKETPPERAAELLAAADKLIVKTRGSA